MSKKSRQAYIKKHWGKYTNQEFAELLGVHRNTITRDIRELGLKRTETKEKTATDFVKELRTKKTLTHEKRKARTLAGRVEELERELDASIQISSHVGTYKIPHKEKTGKKSRAVAVAIASDWHCEEEISSSTVNGMNSFDKQECDLRVERYFRHLAKLIKINQGHAQIDTLILAILGDMLSGNIHEELLASCRLRPIDACIEVLEYLAGGIAYLLEQTDVNLLVPCKVGN